MADNTKFPVRVDEGQESEYIFKGKIYRRFGKHVFQISQENWSSLWLHNILAKLNTEDAELIKHIPDMDPGAALVEVKTALDINKHDYATIEKPSYEACERFHKMGVPVYIVWRLSKTFFVGNNFANFTEDYVNKDLKSRGGGSGKPMFGVSRKILIPLDRFWKYLVPEKYRGVEEGKVSDYEIRSCPFCGSDDTLLVAEIDSLDGILKYSIKCSKCSSSGPNKIDKVDSMIAWNGNPKIYQSSRLLHI